MKKTLFFMIILAVFATGCKKDKSKSLDYNGGSVVTIALRDYYRLPVSSEYDISYSTSNDTYVTVSADGVVYGKNVGNAEVTMSNGYETRTVTVKVDLFIEPTFEFGCSSANIRALYGSPYQAGYNDDGILVYQYTTNQGYSYACGEMDFFFYDGSYYESDVYIRPSVEYLLNNYLTENFTLHSEIYDTVTTSYPTTHDTIIPISIYKNKIDTTVICGKRLALNQWNEFLLFYFQLNDEENAVANPLKTLPRSSKLRY